MLWGDTSAEVGLRVQGPLAVASRPFQRFLRTAHSAEIRGVMLGSSYLLQEEHDGIGSRPLSVGLAQ